MVIMPLDESFSNAINLGDVMTFAEIEAAVAALPLDEQKRLCDSLASRIGQAKSSSPHSVLDIPPVSLGEILKPLTGEDDLLDEMLESRI
jgi:hypothetical protein